MDPLYSTMPLLEISWANLLSCSDNRLWRSNHKYNNQQKLLGCGIHIQQLNNVQSMLHHATINPNNLVSNRSSSSISSNALSHSMFQAISWIFSTASIERISASACALFSCFTRILFSSFSIAFNLFATVSEFEAWCNNFSRISPPTPNNSSDEAIIFRISRPFLFWVEVSLSTLGR